MLICIRKYLFIVGRKRSLEDTSLGRGLKLHSFTLFLLRTLWELKVLIEFIMPALWIRLSLKLIEVVDLQLSPYKISPFRVFLNSPPESTLQQAFHQQVIVPFSQVILITVLRLERICIF
jgi:hypothetical protein